jgi:feruloyl esterase
MKWMLVCVVALPAVMLAQAQDKCAALAQLKSPGMVLEIDRAQLVAAGLAAAPGGGGAGAAKGKGAPKGPGPGAAKGPGPGAAKGGPAAPPIILPAHCRLNGIIDRRVGTDGKTYGIRFAIAMPENWTGQYLQMGGGGLNGSVAEPVGGQMAGTQPALVRGMAVASTDTGHQSSGGGFDGSFQQDQQASLDFQYVANGRVAVLAKQIIETYYGRPPEHSYFVGCSTGGREAMIMTQRYPSYFDGVVSVAPAMRTGHSNLATKTVQVALNAVGGLSDGDRKAIMAKLTEVCDMHDGVADGMIFDTIGCNFNPSSLQCAGAKAEGCLSAAQVAALNKGFAGPIDSRGNPVYAGWFFDLGITATGGGIPGIISGGGAGPIPASTATTQNVDAEAAQVNNNPSSRLGDSYSWTNLGGFSSHGGKLIFAHGVSDPWFSAKDTVDYYQRMTTANGGASKVADWSRLFLSPGMGHCAGGPSLDQFDLLSAAVNWVEKKQAPDAIIATGRTFAGRSRPLCAYPAHAQYKGSGDPEKAENFSCQQ